MIISKVSILKGEDRKENIIKKLIKMEYLLIYIFILSVLWISKLLFKYHLNMLTSIFPMEYASISSECNGGEAINLVNIKSGVIEGFIICL